MVGDGSLGGEGDIGTGVDPAELGGFEEGVEDRRDLGAPLQLRSVVVSYGAGL